VSNLGANKHGTRWVWAGISDSDVRIVLGTSNSNLNNARKETTPSSLPPFIANSNAYKLIAKIIIKNGITPFVQIDTIADAAFQKTSTTAHNDTSGIQGGAVGDYQHLTSAEKTTALDTAHNNLSGLQGGTVGDRQHLNSLELIRLQLRDPVGEEAPLHSGTDLLTDLSLGNVHSATLTHSGMLSNPINLIVGNTHTWVITQHASLAKTLIFGSFFKFQGSNTINSALGSVTVIRGTVVSATEIMCSIIGSGRVTNAFWHTTNGYGSSSTKIPKFVTEVDASNDIIVTVVNSPTLGFTITANVNCTLHVSSYIAYSLIGRWSGISKNSTQLTTNYTLININDRIGGSFSHTLNAPVPVVFSLDLTAGDVIRPHTNGDTIGNNPYNSISVLAIEKL